jgi:TRAP-type C4-dicarboxylate transport system substrate-binding protein
VPQGDHIAEIAFKAAGVTPIPLPLADVYTSLETGLIDTVANTTSGAIAFQWHTKVKYVLDLPLTYVVGILVVDKKAVDALGADDQKVLNDEIGAAFARLDKITRDDNAQARDALQKQGVKIAAPTAAEAKEWDETGVEARKEIAAGGGISPALAAAFDKALAAARAK